MSISCIKNGVYTKFLRFFSSRAGKILSACLALIPAFLAAATVLYYIWGPAEGYFHSDCTDNLLWANASIESGEVFDENFRYAGLLPFSSTIWMIPLIKIFGYGMMAQNIGMSIFALLFIAAVYFFCRVSGFGRFWSSSTVAVTVLFLSSSDKLREIMYGHTIYYSMAPLILFALGAFFILARKSLEKKKLSALVWELLIALLCAATATDGGQVIVIGSLPVIAAVIAERFFCGEDKLISRKNGIIAMPVIIAAVGTLIGLMVLDIWKGDSIDCSYANAYSGWSDISIWVSNAQNFVKHYFSLLGVAACDGSLFSFESIGMIIRIAGGIIILAVPLVMLLLYKKIKNCGVKIALWAHFVVSAAVMFGFICGKLSGANWRLTPIISTAAALSVMGARELCVNGMQLLRARNNSEAACFEDTDNCAGFSGCEKIPVEEKEDSGEKIAVGRVLIRTGAAGLAVLMIFSCLIANEIRKMPSDYGRDNYRHELADFLVEKNLKYGYATFWQSQAITAISDSQTKCREILADASRGVYSDHYQSSKLWYTTLAEGYDNYYILLSDSEYRKVYDTDSWKEWVSEYLIASYGPDEGLREGFKVFVFSVNVLAFTEE